MASAAAHASLSGTRPPHISILDKGEVLVLIDDATFKKFEFLSDTLKGLWIAQRSDAKTELWGFFKSERVAARQHSSK